MKKILTILSVFMAFQLAYSQTPQALNYQAVIRNNSNQIVANAPIGMQVSILQGSATGTAVYVERHFPSTSNTGIVNLRIGTGTVVSGTFANINWGTGTYFLKTETDLNGGANYTLSGTSQILSVPYALQAKVAETADYNKLTNKPTLKLASWGEIESSGRIVGSSGDIIGITRGFSDNNYFSRIYNIKFSSNVCPTSTTKLYAQITPVNINVGVGLPSFTTWFYDCTLSVFFMESGTVSKNQGFTFFMYSQ